MRLSENRTEQERRHLGRRGHHGIPLSFSVGGVRDVQCSCVVFCHCCVTCVLCHFSRREWAHGGEMDAHKELCFSTQVLEMMLRKRNAGIFMLDPIFPSFCVIFMREKCYGNRSSIGNLSSVTVENSCFYRHQFIFRFFYLVWSGGTNDCRNSHFQQFLYSH